MIRVAGEVTDGSAEGRGWGQHHDMLVGIQREEPVLPTLEALTAGAGLPPRPATTPISESKPLVNRAMAGYNGPRDHFFC